MTEPAPATPAAPGPVRVRAWDPAVRVFHWSLAALFLLNLAVLDEDAGAHEVVGYAVLALVAARLVWGVVGAPTARFGAFPPSLSAARAHLAAMLSGAPERPHLSHNPLGALMVYNLLATMLALGLTGWMLTTDAFWGVEWVGEVHEALADWAAVSVVLHVAGVVIASRRSRVPLVRAMLTGWKVFPGPRS